MVDWKSHSFRPIEDTRIPTPIESSSLLFERISADPWEWASWATSVAV